MKIFTQLTICNQKRNALPTFIQFQGQHFVKKCKNLRQYKISPASTIFSLLMNCLSINTLTIQDSKPDLRHCHTFRASTKINMAVARSLYNEQCSRQSRKNIWMTSSHPDHQQNQINGFQVQDQSVNKVWSKFVCYFLR